MKKLLSGECGEVWLSKEAIKNRLGCTEVDVNLLLDGLSKSAGKDQFGEFLVRSGDLENFLVNVRNMADVLLPRVFPKAEKKQAEFRTLKLREAARRLGCNFRCVKLLVEKHGLPAKKKGKTLLFKSNEVDEFALKNKELIVSLRKKAKKKGKTEHRNPGKETESSSRRARASPGA
jgi:excisionase family DNA binding protein